MEVNEIRRARTLLVLLLAGGGVVAALAALPWHTYAISVPGAGSFRFDRTGLQSPEEALGRLALVASAALALTAGLLLVRGRERPDLGRFDPFVIILGLAAAALLVAKLVVNTDFLGTGAWVSVAVGVIIVLGSVSLRRFNGN